MWVHGFRFYFTPLAGVLFAFPSRYFCAIGRISYLAFDRGRPGFRQGFSCPAVLRYRQRSPRHFAYGDFTLSVRLSQCLSAMAWFSPTPPLSGRRPFNPQLSLGLGSSGFARRYSRNLFLISFPGVLRWFSSPSLASRAYFIQRRDARIAPGGLPHSATDGSLDVCSSPSLFAACRGLLRLDTPRHPP